jgi:ubiquinone/menaquinone biosynthesis C-methylase UbiE
MPDPYATIAKIDESIQESLSNILELRGADTRQQEMLESYLASIDLPDNAYALEVGCGTGVVSRYLTNLNNIKSVTGIDPSPVFIEKARELGKDITGLTFSTGDARSLNFDDESFDLVVFHTTLCHIPSPTNALKEAYRVLCPGGVLAIFDGDYVSATVALDKHDPLQVAVERMVDNFVENIWLTRQLPKILTNLGLTLKVLRSHGYTAVSDPSYMLTLIDRGIEVMVASGILGQNQGDALQSEARRRVDSGEFFGQINYVSTIAQKD